MTSYVSLISHHTRFPDVKSSVSPEMMICSKGWPLYCGDNSIFWVHLGHLGQTNKLNKCHFLFI